MNPADIMPTGYGAAQYWCLRCDVGWPRQLSRKGPCWLCGKADEVYQWQYGGPKGPVFVRVPEEER